MNLAVADWGGETLHLWISLNERMGNRGESVLSY